MHTPEILNAAFAGDYKKMETLIAQGVDVRERATKGGKPLKITALHLSATIGHPYAINLLLKAGADPNDHDLDSGSPLEAACVFGSGLALDEKKAEYTGILRAERWYIKEILLGQGKPMPVGQNTLYTVELLIDAGAVITKNAVYYATQLGRTSIVDRLLQERTKLEKDIATLNEMAQEGIKENSVDLCLAYWNALFEKLKQLRLDDDKPSKEIIEGTLRVIIQNTQYQRKQINYQPLIEILNKLKTFNMYRANNGFRADLREALTNALKEKIARTIKDSNKTILAAERDALKLIQERLEIIQGASRFTREKTAMTTIKNLINTLNQTMNALADKHSHSEESEEARETTPANSATHSLTTEPTQHDDKKSQMTLASRHTLFSSPNKPPITLYDLTKLATEIDNGNVEKINPYIHETNPNILLTKRTTFYPASYYQSNRYNYPHKTLFQVLLMNSEFIKAIAIGEFLTDEERQAQFYEIFPDGIIKKYDFDPGEAERLLKNLFDQLKNDPIYNPRNLDEISSSTREALKAVKAYAKPHPTIDKGLVFDPNFYLIALNIRDSNEARELFR